MVAALANAWVAQGKEVHVVTTSPLESTPEEDYALSTMVTRHHVGQKLRFWHRLTRAPLTRWFILGLWDYFYQALELLGDAGEQVAYRITRWRRRGTVPALKKVLAELDEPVLFVFTSALFPVAVLACEGSATRFVAMERNDPALEKVHAEIDIFRRLIYQRATLVTANSRIALTKMASMVAREKLAYIPNPLFDKQLLHAEAVNVAQNATILIVARLVAQKNHALLLRAFAMLPATLNHWRLSIVGDGILRKPLMALAKRLGVDPRIDWHGYTSNPFPFYRQASMFVLPSAYEGQSNALLEAMSVGLPVIVSDTPTLVEMARGKIEMSEMADQMPRGLVVPGGDVDALARAIEQLALNVDLRRQLGQAGREYALSHDPAVVLPQWDQLLARAQHS